MTAIRIIQKYHDLVTIKESFMIIFLGFNQKKSKKLSN